MKESIRRVARMEEIFDKSYAAVNDLLLAAQKYVQAESQLRELEAYYQSPQWMADFEAERADAFPKSMKRGILTEDAIYDLLTDEYRLHQLLEQLRR